MSDLDQIRKLRTSVGKIAANFRKASRGWAIMADKFIEYADHKTSCSIYTEEPVLLCDCGYEEQVEKAQAIVQDLGRAR